MYRFWFGLHFLLVVCLVPGPSWATTASYSKTPNLTVDQVLQHEISKSRQLVRHKQLRAMGLDPMSVLADQIKVKFDALLKKEMRGMSAAQKQQLATDLQSFQVALGGMYTTTHKYKNKKISAARARQQMQQHHDKMYDFFSTPVGKKVYNLWKTQAQQYQHSTQRVMWVHDEFIPTSKSRSKIKIKNLSEKQLTQPFHKILPKPYTRKVANEEPGDEVTEESIPNNSSETDEIKQDNTAEADKKSDAPHIRTLKEWGLVFGGLTASAFLLQYIPVAGLWLAIPFAAVSSLLLLVALVSAMIDIVSRFWNDKEITWDTTGQAVATGFNLLPTMFRATKNMFKDVWKEVKDW